MKYFWLIFGVLIVFLGVVTYISSGGDTILGVGISPNLNIGSNTSSTISSSASLILAARSETQIQWCYNGASGIWIGATTTNLVAGASGSGFYVATSTVLPDSFRDYPGAIYGVTNSGTTSTLNCARF